MDMEKRMPGAGQMSVTDSDVEYLPREELALLQECLLAQAVRRAAGAPFFRERIQALGDVGDRLAIRRFQELVPLTSKQDLRQARDAAWVTGATGQITLLLTTSGTTGTRIALPYTAHDLWRWYGLSARTLRVNGLLPDDVVVLPVPLGLFTGGHGMLGGLQRLGCTVLPIGPVPSPVMAEAFRGAYGAVPTAIVTLPSHMLRLLDSLPAAGYDPREAPLRIGSFGAEPWTAEARQRIEDGFRLQAVDSYGIGELCGPGVAAECAYRDGMHIWEDAFFAEVIDPSTGQPVPEGTPGELVLTSLFREVLPLLRYRTGDEVSLTSAPCPCGRTHRRISRIGRRLDKILIITGVNIDPTDIERLLYALPWLGNEFALEAGGENRDTLVLHAETRAGYQPPADAETQIIAGIRRYFPVRTIVHLYQPGALERAPGKAQRIRG